MFTCGVLCMATKRNALGVLMGVELVLNGANLNFVAFGSKYLRAESLGLDGQLIALFVIVLAAAEALSSAGVKLVLTGRREDKLAAHQACLPDSVVKAGDITSPGLAADLMHAAMDPRVRR